MAEIHESISANNNLIIRAEPGAGKSTALPLSLLNCASLSGKKILMLEPRRVAAKSIAHYLARQLHENIGQRIGYQIKNDRKKSQETIIEVVTEGILTRRLQDNPELPGVGLIIFDEFHERSIHADLSLMFALEVQHTIREDLKLLIMSATIDTQKISEYMDGAEIIECSGRTFPVNVSYTKPSKSPLSDTIIEALSAQLHHNPQGDILIFLPGQSDIEQCLKKANATFRADKNLVFLPLYGSLPLAQQEKALSVDPNGRQRVIFSTNISETSLTIEGVSTVIDSGLEKKLVYDPTSCMTRLETSMISKSSAEQRKGRAGRTQPGSCVRLWDEHKHATLKTHQSEEIMSADLGSAVLEILAWGAQSIDDVNWLTQPPDAHLRSAEASLQALGLIDIHGKVTALGEKANGLGLPPRLAAMLLKAKGHIEQGIASELAALVSDRDIFHGNKDIDICMRMMAWQAFKTNRRTALKEYPLIGSLIEQRHIQACALRRSLNLDTSSKKIYSLAQLQDNIGKLLLNAYPDRLAKRRSPACGRYQMANGRGAFLFDDDPLYGSDWLVISDCDAQKNEGRIFRAAKIDFHALMDNLAGRLVEKEVIEYDEKKKKITGRRISCYEAIEIRSSAMSTIPPDKLNKCLVQALNIEGFALLNWTPLCDAWLSRAEWLGKHIDAFPKISKKNLLQDIENWLTPYLGNTRSLNDFKKVDILALLVGKLSWQEQQMLEQEAPKYYQAASGKQVQIRYDDQQGPTVSIQLQEMFGETRSPAIAAGSIKIRFEFLSPARRPIQTTSDLENFWKTSYLELAKEMRSKYPKHRWPDQPALEKPGRSIKLNKKY